jgi:hypothetical protein
MLRDLLDRFAYRYQFWVGETQGDKVGAGEPLPEISPKSESAWRMVVRFVLGIVSGLILLVTSGRIGIQEFPASSTGIRMTVIYLASIWCGVGLFLIAGQLLTKCKEKHADDDERTSGQL